MSGRGGVEAGQTVKETIRVAAIKLTATGSAVDLMDCDRATVVIPVGLWTDGTFTFKLQDSMDNSSYADVTAIDLDGSFTVVNGATLDETVYKVGYTGVKRYVRVVCTVTGSPATGCVFGVCVIRGDHKYSIPPTT
jgi:hypothetical protein